MRASGNFDQRRNELLCDGPSSVRVLCDPAERDGQVAVAILFFDHQPEVCVQRRHLGVKGFGVKVGNLPPVGQVTRRPRREFVAIRAVAAKCIDRGQAHINGCLGADAGNGCEIADQREWIVLGGVYVRPVSENGVERLQAQGSAPQGLAVDLGVANSPRVAVRVTQVARDCRLNEQGVLLEVLRAQE